MRKLDTETRALIIRLLVEGRSIRATSRIAGVSKNTVNKLLIDAGRACAKYHDGHVRNVNASVIQCDEIWSFTYVKPKTVSGAKAAPDQVGDICTWTAIDSDSKLIVSYMIGRRDSECAIAFMDDLRDRLANYVQLTTNGYKAHLVAAEGALRDGVDFAQLIKLYGGEAVAKDSKKKLSPAECIGIEKSNVAGRFDQALISANSIERHMYAVALHFMHYNFVRVHQALRVTPAMEAGLTDRLWGIADLVAVVDANQPASKRRGPYRRRQAKTSK